MKSGQAPRLPKAPFLVGDAVLLATAWLIAAHAGPRWSGATGVTVAACVALGALIGVIPFLTDYARRQDEALDDRQRALEALARTIAASAEQIGIAAGGLNEIAGQATQNLRQVEQFSAQFSSAAKTGTEQFAKTLSQCGAQGAERIEAAAEKIAQLVGTIAETGRRLAEKRRQAEPPEPASSPAPEPKPEPKSESAAAAPEPPRKPKLKAPPPAEPTLGLDDSEPVASAAEPPGEDALSSDGASRLLVTAYIGIGNRLFIRGEGPGLTWDQGVPLQFVSIGKWRWEAPSGDAPIRFKLYKNDQIECSALGERTIEPGRQQELTAAF